MPERVVRLEAVMDRMERTMEQQASRLDELAECTRRITWVLSTVSVLLVASQTGLLEKLGALLSVF